MPTHDENGNMIGMDDFPIALRGDDAVEWIVPGSPMPKVVLTNDPEEHDCLPPLEAPNDVPWTLSDEAAEKLMALIDQQEGGDSDSD